MTMIINKKIGLCFHISFKNKADQIKAEFHKAVLLYHPDKGGDGKKHTFWIPLISLFLKDCNFL